MVMDFLNEVEQELGTTVPVLLLLERIATALWEQASCARLTPAWLDEMPEEEMRILLGAWDGHKGTHESHE